MQIRQGSALPRAAIYTANASDCESRYLSFPFRAILPRLALLGISKDSRKIALNEIPPDLRRLASAASNLHSIEKDSSPSSLVCSECQPPRSGNPRDRSLACRMRGVGTVYTTVPFFPGSNNSSFWSSGSQLPIPTTFQSDKLR